MSKPNRHLEGGKSSRLPLTPSSSNLTKQKTPWRPKPKLIGSKENVPPQAVAAVKSSPLQSLVKRKLNIQKVTLNYPLSLPKNEDDSDVEMEIVDQDDHFSLHSVETKERGDKDENQPQEVKKVDVGVQTLLPDLVPKGVEKVLAEAIKREMELEKLCARRNSEIMHLKRMVQQHQHEREFNATTSEMWQDQILRLENLLTTATYSAVSEGANEENNAEQRLEQERLQWMTLVEELRSELQDSRALAEKYEQDLELEKKCSEKAMLEMGSMLEQYVNLEEKHLDLLERIKTIQENVKKSPTKELLARMLFKK